MSEMSDEQSDALAVARWAWPEHQVGDGQEWVSTGGFTMSVFSPSEHTGDGFSLHGISDAERVVLARGLAEQYGRALTEQLVSGGDIDCAAFFRSLHEYVRATMLATAPLSSRLRALAKVARENPGWNGHPVDVAKALLREMGETLSPEVEAAMRKACDEEVAGENPLTPREIPCPFVHGDSMCQCSCGKECGKFSGHCREHGNFVRFGGRPA